MQKSANVVAYLSLLLLTINLVSLLMSSTSDTMSLVIDLGIFVAEFLSIVSLLYGISNKAANYLRPYLIFGVGSAFNSLIIELQYTEACQIIWNLSLFVLWIFCVIKLLHSREAFVLKILWNTSTNIAGMHGDMHNSGNNRYMLTAAVAHSHKHFQQARCSLFFCYLVWRS